MEYHEVKLQRMKDGGKQALVAVRVTRPPPLPIVDPLMTPLEEGRGYRTRGTSSSASLVGYYRKH